jgi:CheY-like chemotaxis protein
MNDQSNQTTCLLIDDDVDDQEVFKMCLKKINPNIVFKAVSDGVEALKVLGGLASYKPDYIFLDVNMPKMNGLACLRELKSLKTLEHTKIYMYSTTSEKASVSESLNMGAEDFIIKPAKTADLKAKLSSIFAIVTEINKKEGI